MLHAPWPILNVLKHQIVRFQIWYKYLQHTPFSISSYVAVFGYTPQFSIISISFEKEKLTYFDTRIERIFIRHKTDGVLF